MILVTGGTGLVGSHLLLNLLKAGKKVRALHRKNSDLAAVEHVFNYYTSTEEAKSLFQQIEWFEADITNIPQLNVAFKNIQYVYHCAALVSFDPADDKKLRKINIEGTAKIVNLCIAFKVEKLCYVSSVAALGKSLNNKEINERSTWNPEDDHSDYAISKYGAEIETWRGTQEGVPTVIVKPGVIIGPGFWEEGTGKIFSKIDKGMNYHFPKIAGFVGVKDVVDVMQKIMQAEIANEDYILVSENLSFKTVFELTATELGKPKPQKSLKKWMLWFGWFFQKIGGFFGAKRNITKNTVNTLFQHAVYNNEKIKGSIGFEFTPMQKVIAETAKCYKKDKA
ncbi:NAD-dependent epimerase/dehydratase family protein [Salegentibacter mishustinae]|uniref:NAD-dependent epimerase n=1 Tax=Salegentibacter mishustinae TaxID=270918 RepID=A0A0Q9Z4V9_9FLAO|nr:NAD-dependent epimerase/dehydratase family protein [Salegentibacter mishustinae]KRG27919.1 NAD-dependent epimerase [Salegentibacter mishustinae]PNW20987.1 NAD-dependent epimerase [Salegentibacter mishustinae]PZX63994.1 nucleoside-diphosphate-sugar epimerase [Salegentibacter mishustinae]GGW89445.1 NAD-dependent epimerase [Salegentibacter mishustinae]